MEFPNRFIKATQEACSFEQHVPAPYLRRSFTLDFQPERAELLISGQGFYVLYVNGEDVTKGALAPYISNPDDICYYDRYELAVQLKTGENVLGIMLGNGFMNPFGGAIWDFEKAAWLGAPRVAFRLHVEGQGKSVDIEADEEVRTHSSPVVFDEIRMGTYYDANLELPGWNAPGFDDADWAPALPAERPRGEARLCTADPIVKTAELAPVSRTHYDELYYSTYENKPVESTYVEDAWMYDFGINMSGVCRLKIKGEKGQKITLRHADHMIDGKFSINTTIFQRPGFEFYYQYGQTDTYTLKGGEEEIFVPPFTYHGFRYVLVEGLKPEQATDGLLTFLVMNSDLARRGSFTCSDEMVNKLYDCTMRSDVSNFYYFPTDCPHREKNGWTADAALSAEHVLLNFEAANSYAVWLDNIRKAQRDDGALPGIVPTPGWGFEWGNGPAWDAVLIYLPYFCYKYQGDSAVILDNEASILRYLHYLTTRMDERGLLAIGLGDWCQPFEGPNGPDSPLLFTDSAMAYDIAQKSAFLFGRVGHTVQRDFARTIADGLRASIRAHLIDFDTMTVVGDCQTSQAVAIAFGIFEEAELPAARARLLEFIEQKNGLMHTGVIGGRYIFHVLADMGRADLAHSMITRTECPAYGYWIAQGATTLWESFRTPDMLPDSHNHHFWGDIASWFMQVLAGLRYNPGADDVRRVDVAPAFIPALTHAEASFCSVCGGIEAGWKRQDGGIVLCVSVPDGMHGEIRLPDGYCFEDGARGRTLCSGEYAVQQIK